MSLEAESAMEVKEAFAYLENDLRQSIVGSANFETFNRLTFSRYVSEESHRYDLRSIEFNVNFDSHVVECAEEFYNTLTEVYEKLLIIHEESDCPPSKSYTFDQAFNLVNVFSENADNSDK